MQVAIIGTKTMKTCQATWDMTAMIPKSCMNEKAHLHIAVGIFMSTVLWSVEACKRKREDKIK